MHVHQGGVPCPWGARPVRGALAAITVVALLLVAMTSPTASAEGPSARAASAQDLRGLVNAERRARGLAPVATNARLTRAARGHSADMVRQGYASHVSRDGRRLRGRVSDAGYLEGARSWVLGEAIAWGSGASASATAVLDALMASPTHKAVLLDPDVREIGVGLTRGLPRAGGAGRGITVVLDFGLRRR